MIRVTYETKHGDFTEDYEYFGYKVGDRCFTKSPFITRRGTYKVVKIENIENKENEKK